jgi:hypothetical protein
MKNQSGQLELFPAPVEKTHSQKVAEVRAFLLAKRAEASCRLPKIISNLDATIMARPRGDGAIEAFEREANLATLDDDDYFES